MRYWEIKFECDSSWSISGVYSFYMVKEDMPTVEDIHRVHGILPNRNGLGNIVRIIDITLDQMPKDKKVCFTCIRKTECYTEKGLKDLKPNETYKDKTGYECGATFTNYEELREFVYVIGEAINKQNKRVQKDIMKFIADKYNLPLYNVMLEFER